MVQKLLNLKQKTVIKNIDSDDASFYPCGIFVNSCSGSCNNINDPYAKLGIPDVVKSINIKVFNLMSKTNETRHAYWHETFTCKCRLDASVYNDNQRWENDKCRCECKELIHKGICDKGFTWNPGNRKCDKSCDVG